MSKDRVKKIIGISAAVIGTGFIITSIIAKKKKAESIYKNDPDQRNPFEGKNVIFVEDDMEPENADGVRGHLEETGTSDYKESIYSKYIKRGFDVVLSFGGLVVLSPVLLGISLAIKIDDPGPVLFTQKRLGKNKQYFKLHKFRTMKMNTPHDVPTHQLENPEQYITKVGKFLRAHSLDELPQIWDIFIGNMSTVGPRPGLWNQDLLTAERDKYGANDVKPGLTGWAQINGRDELEIPDKAKLDGEYTEKIGLSMDIKCFLGSLHVFGKDDSVVEGGTGEMHKVGRHYTDEKSDEDLIGNIGFGESVIIEKDAERRVLITGTGSYIGESFRAYATEHYPSLHIDTVDMIDGRWREANFSSYDIVYHVAGIAHADVGNVDEATKAKYYAVNTDLAVEVCEKAKKDGVGRFVFMSSAIVYGDSAPYGTQKIIDDTTVPHPANFYGDSKLQADVAVRDMADDKFKVIVLRPPMIYGRGSKGNYPTLAKLAKKMPVFPNVKNERSMLHIDNLCEFLCQLMLVKEVSRDAVVLIPQNPEWTETPQMVKAIGAVSGKNIMLIGMANPAVAVAGKMPGKIGGLVNKAFGNLAYDQGISNYEGMDYQIVDLKESIERTEGGTDIKNSEKISKRILFLVNHDVVIYNFRLEIVERFIADGHEVHISSPYGERIDELVALGAKFHEITMDRHGMNPKEELRILIEYKKLIEEIKPDICLGFTIKPNIYGAIAARKYDVPFVANITGLGTAVENPGLSQQAAVALYKYAFRGIQRVFYQNEENRQFFVDHGIEKGKGQLLPGSGVNLERYPYRDYPEDGVIKFAFISRIMKEKGIDQYLEAAEEIRKRHDNVEFHVCGFCEPEYDGRLQEKDKDGTVIYHGMIKDVAGMMAQMHCVIHPTYYPEGLSNVLLEASATGRPIITTDRSGCREVVDDGINGYMIPCQDSGALVEAIDKFLSLSWDEKKELGKAARVKVEREFDRQIVVEKYVEEVNKA